MSDVDKSDNQKRIPLVQWKQERNEQDMFMRLAENFCDNLLMCSVCGHIVDHARIFIIQNSDMIEVRIGCHKRVLITDYVLGAKDWAKEQWVFSSSRHLPGFKDEPCSF